MTTFNEVRQRPHRVVNKTERYVEYEQQREMGKRKSPESAEDLVQQDVYPGLNDIADLFELFPQDLIRYFTLLKEIDAKCVYTVPYLRQYIAVFLKMAPENPKRQLLLFKIRSLIKELMPSLEEKMHVASILCDTVQRHVTRIEDDYLEIIRSEIPDSVRIGPLNHPLMILEAKPETSKSAQSQRSESRRELLLLKKLLNINAPIQDIEEDEGTPQPVLKKRKQVPAPKKKKEEDNSRSGTPLNVLPKKKKPLATISVQQQAVQQAHQVTITKEENTFSQEPLYCYCQNVSYGEMVGCDGEDCKLEWFHLPCLKLAEPPKGKWYCKDCAAKLKRR